MATKGELEPDEPPNVDDVPSSLPYRRATWAALRLDAMTRRQALAQYTHPLEVRMAAKAHGVECSFRLATMILLACGWEIPDDIAWDPSLPKQLRLFQEHTSVIPLSRYFHATPGDVLEVFLRGQRWRAAVLPSGKLQDMSGGDPTPITPTAWTRRVRGRTGSQSVNPGPFWRRVEIVDHIDLVEFE